MAEKKYKNILVDAMMHLGDLIHATSVIPLLKKLYPGCKVSFLVEPGLVSLFENIDGVEHVISYSYKSKGDYLAVFKMGKELKKYNFDLSISLDPRTRLAAMMWIANIPTRVGSRSIFWNESGIERFFFTDYVEWGSYICKEHPAAENFQKLIKLFADADDDKFYKPKFAVSQKNDIDYINCKLNKLPKSDFKIAFCVKTVDEARNWAPERFAELMNKIIEKYKADIIITGVKSDNDTAEQIIASVKDKNKILNLCGKTNLKQLNALFSKMNFLINFDNGMGHFAAAAGCSTITLFSNALPTQFTPLHDKTLIVQSGLDCIANCNKKLRKTCGLKCLEAVTVDKVMEKVDMMIKSLGAEK